MQSTDRDEFKVQFGILCAGYDKPVGDRDEAYWKGLAKMSLLEFARCVEFCLGEEGPEKMPTAPGMWNIRKRLKAKPAEITLPARVMNHGIDGHIYFFANRLLLRHMIWRGGLGEIELAKCLEVKAELILEFAPFIRERDEMATKGEFVRRFSRMIDRVSPLAKSEKWDALLEDPVAAEQFPPNAVEGISPTGTFDFR